MRAPGSCASPRTDIRRAARATLDRDLAGVCNENDDETLVGFVSQSDILRAVVTDPPLSIWRQFFDREKHD